MNEASPIATATDAALQAARRPATTARIGVLIVNLGTPDATDAAGRCAAISRNSSPTRA